MCGPPSLVVEINCQITCAVVCDILNSKIAYNPDMDFVVIKHQDSMQDCLELFAQPQIYYPSCTLEEH
jgi:SUMO ligase MMS21 Smc5/6 complex component